MNLLKRGREAFLDAHADARDWAARGFSGTTYSLWQATRSVMREHCTGLVLDAGVGRGVWRSTALENATGYESIDLAPRGSHQPTWVGDICAMPQVPDGRYDSVVCHQVLEHVRQPGRALDEIRRVLRPGGTVILSVPHLSRRHELPHDYFRFTQEGVALILGQHGFETVEVRGYGGLLSFLHHQTSFFFPGLLTGLPVLGPVASLVNFPIAWLVSQVDPLIDRTGLLATGVMAVGRRPAADGRPGC